eukprot:CAMPEP_0118914568 /NCGR_PEP_ID=MMETSP1166-20130328/14914_1 /TAXON_ID=1104430 /ORGANISM="Chrysoreinhardia sp, Strain CCMP3193" /LENGTH=1547 /DNA_ID=CAMNT_0006854171 /DNA_START=84 /DNA_END=4727 /DNA_ORIENTATION=+
MSKLLKLKLQGIRSFSPDEQAEMEFYSPLTMIVGKNGCGKTTIIECLKYGLTGKLPPGCRTGASFVHDLTISQRTQLKAAVRVRFRGTGGAHFEIIRLMECNKRGKANVTFKSLDQTIRHRNAEGKMVAMTHKCGDVDKTVPTYLGVSGAVLNLVIFCHQEESSWPLSDSKELKGKFDDIFEASRYSKALTSLKSQRNELKNKIGFLQVDLRDLEVSKRDADSKKEKLATFEATIQRCDEGLEDVRVKEAHVKERLENIKLRASQVRTIERDVERLRIKLATAEESLKSNFNLEDLHGDDVPDEALLESLQQAESEDSKVVLELSAAIEAAQAKLERARRRKDDAGQALGGARAKLEGLTLPQHKLDDFVTTYNTNESLAATSSSAVPLDAKAVEVQLQDANKKAWRAVKTADQNLTAANDASAKDVANKEAAVQVHEQSLATLDADVRAADRDFRDADAKLRDLLLDGGSIEDKEAEVERLEEREQRKKDDLHAAKDAARQIRERAESDVADADDKERRADKAIADERAQLTLLQEQEGAEKHMSALAQTTKEAKRTFKRAWLAAKPTVYPLAAVKALALGQDNNQDDDDDDIMDHFASRSATTLQDEDLRSSTTDETNLDLKAHAAYVDGAQKAASEALTTRVRPAADKANEAQHVSKADLNSRLRELAQAEAALTEAKAKAKHFVDEQDSHPRYILGALRTRCNNLLRTVFGDEHPFGEEEAESSSSSSSKGGRKSHTVSKISKEDQASCFESSKTLLVQDYPSCLDEKLGFDDDDDDDDALDDEAAEARFDADHYRPATGGASALAQTVAWVRAFASDARGFESVKKAESTLAASYEKRLHAKNNQFACPLCRRMFDQDDDQEMDDLKNTQRKIQTMHEVSKISLEDEFTEISGLLQDLADLEHGKWKDWGDARDAVVRARALVETRTEAKDDAEKVAADNEAKAADARDKAEALSTMVATLQQLAYFTKDARAKERTLHDAREKARGSSLVGGGTSLGLSSSSTSTSTTTKEAIDKIDELNRTQKECAAKKTEALQATGKATERVALATDEATKATAATAEARNVLEKARVVSKQRADAKAKKADLKTKRDTAASTTADLEKEVDLAKAKQEKTTAELRAQLRSAQDSRNAAHGALAKVLDLKEAVRDGSARRASLEKEKDDLEQQKADAAKAEAESQALIDDLQTRMQEEEEPQAAKDATKRRLRDTIKYRETKRQADDTRRDIADLKAQLQQTNNGKRKKRSRKDDDDDDDDEKDGKDDDAEKEEEELPSTLEELDGLLEKARERLTKVQQKAGDFQNRRKWSLEEKQTLKKELAAAQYKDVDQRCHDKRLEVHISEKAVYDLDQTFLALDTALQTYHSAKMAKVNEIIRELWQVTYRGEDIDEIAIVSGEEAGSGRATRNYNYQVQMAKGNAKIDMRGRCSAGQRVLASIVIRLALAQAFCLHCGIMALDEPTTNLDEPNRKSLANGLARIIAHRSKQSNFQLIIITHDEDFIAAIRQELIVTAKTSMPDFFWRVSRERHKNGMYYSKLSQVDIEELPL